MIFFVTLLLGFFIGDILWWFAGHRRFAARQARLAIAVWAASMLVGLGLIITSRFLGHQWDAALPRPILSVIFIWHLLVLPLWLISRLLGAISKAMRRTPQPSAEGISRREFFAAATTFAPTIIVGGAALTAEAQLEQFRVRRLSVPVTNLPPALDGLSIAQVTDTHIGRFTRSAVLDRIIQTTNDLNADLVLLTGDLINLNLRDLPAGIDLVRSLRGKHGVFLCEGNHDLLENAAEFRRQMLKSSLPFLRGEAETLAIGSAKVQVFGLPWTHGDEAHASALNALDPLRREDAFPIVLAHHPHAFDFAPRFPFMLAGHTHGGQLMLNEHVGFGPLFFRYWSGLYRREGRSLVVSNGAGNWFPVRIAAPAEILHLTLRPA